MPRSTLLAMPLSLALTACLTASAIYAQSTIDTAPMHKLMKDKLGSTINVHSFGPTLLCGQPTPDDLSAAKARGIECIVCLRQPGEIDWDDASLAKGLGLDFERIGFRAPETLTDEVFDKTRDLLKKSEMTPVMLQCGSANRVGAIWAAHRALDHGLSIDAALAEGKEVGLRNAGYEKRVREYVEAKRSK